jgi:hypothetical protein
MVIVIRMVIESQLIKERPPPRPKTTDFTDFTYRAGRYGNSWRKFVARRTRRSHGANSGDLSDLSRKTHSFRYCWWSGGARSVGHLTQVAQLLSHEMCARKVCRARRASSHRAQSTNPVRALLVFLNLLERQSDGFTELLLAHPEHQAAHAHAAADVLVDRVRRFGPWHGVAADTYGCV